jgi:hypothetical protein
MVGVDTHSVQNAGRRYFVLLSSDSDSEFLREALRSPLDWVKKTIMEIFSKGFVKYAKNITEKRSEKNASKKGDTQDTISELIAGIRRAKELQHSYPLANYHHTMFSFQQEFHSSYRARKGKVLEEVLKKFCRDSGYVVHKKKSEKWGAIAKSLNLEKQRIVSENSKADVDLVAESEKCLLVIQIRSRDDTGGTTAKGSLAKALIPIVKTAIPNQQKKDIIYLVAVWEPRKEEQFSSLVDELVERLREVLGNMDSLPSDKSIIKQRIRNDNGLEVCDRIFIRVAYGIEEIEQVVSKSSSEENRIEKHTRLSDIECLLGKPDDLWLTYAVVSLELNQLLSKGKTNIDYLKSKIESEVHAVSTEDIDNLAKELHSTWKETALPFEKPADNYLYIRDMLYLYMIYQQHRSRTGKRRKKPNTEIQSQQQHRSRTGKRRKKPNTEIQSQQQFPTMEGL